MAKNAKPSLSGSFSDLIRPNQRVNRAKGIISCNNFRHCLKQGEPFRTLGEDFAGSILPACEPQLADLPELFIRYPYVIAIRFCQGQGVTPDRLLPSDEPTVSSFHSN